MSIAARAADQCCPPRRRPPLLATWSLCCSSGGLIWGKTRPRLLICSECTAAPQRTHPPHSQRLAGQRQSAGAWVPLPVCKAVECAQRAVPKFRESNHDMLPTMLRVCRGGVAVADLAGVVVRARHARKGPGLSGTQRSGQSRAARPHVHQARPDSLDQARRPAPRHHGRARQAAGQHRALFNCRGAPPGGG